jgi:hypothetical protein
MTELRTAEKRKRRKETQGRKERKPERGRDAGCSKFRDFGRGAFLKRRSGTVRSRGGLRRENAGMSSEKKVRIFLAEYPRIPE